MLYSTVDVLDSLISQTWTTKYGMIWNHETNPWRVSWNHQRWFRLFFCQAESFDFPQVWSRSFLFVLKIFKQKMVEKMGSLKQTVRKTEVFKTNQDFGRFWMAPLDQESSRGQGVDSIVSSHMSQKVRTKPGSVGFLDQYSSCRGNQELNCFHFWMWFRFTGWWFGTWLLFSPS